MEEEVGDDLYSDFGPELGVADDGRWAAPTAAATVAMQGGATAPSSRVPEPPLVTVAPGAADLYADLFSGEGSSGGTLLKTQVAELTDRVQRQEVQISGLQQQVDTLTQQNGELSERCATLAANISSLYNTAKLELQRKDAEIRELRERMAAPSGARGRAPAPAPSPRPGSTSGRPPAQHQPAAQSHAGTEQGSLQPPPQQQQQQQLQAGQERRDERRHGRPDEAGRGSSSREHSQPGSRPPGGSRSLASSEEGGGGLRAERYASEERRGGGSDRHEHRSRDYRDRR